jgi:serine/threonine protein kinase
VRTIGPDGAMTPGLIVADRYCLERKLGEGGMGAVWAARHVVTRKMVAIKLLKPELANNASLVERFMREARAACAVKHRHVVQIHDVLQLVSGAPMMVMDLLDGESLAERLQRQGRIPVADFSRIMLQVISAIGAAHAAHVVHRDLKPDNLFLVRTDDGSVDVQVLDFGIAKVSTTDAESGVLTKTGSMLGTPFYMAPEQLFGEKDVDHRADIWSLGIIAYECLTGRRPTEADNLGQIIKVVTTGGIVPLDKVAPFVPADVCAVVQRMLTSDRQARLTDLDEARVVFERYAGASGSAPPPFIDGAALISKNNIRVRSDDLSAAPTGPLHWAATQPDGANAVRRRRAWPILAVVLGLFGLVGASMLVRRTVASNPRPAASGLVAAGSAGVGAGVSSAAEPSTGPIAAASASAPDSSVSVVSSGTAGSPSSEPPVIGVASARGSNTRGAALRPSSSAPTRPSVPPVPTTSSQGVLVDKPPF